VGLGDFYRGAECRHVSSGRVGVAVSRSVLVGGGGAAPGDRLCLEVGAPTNPIAIRRPDDEEGFSILMPVRLED
ncbi:DNA polymerase III subunit beta, partial [Streptomyces sp. NPDC052644]